MDCRQDGRHVLRSTVWLQFLALLLLAIPTLMLGTPEVCPPAAEDQPFTISYTTNLTWHLRDLFWRFRRPDGTEVDVSYCYHEETVCYDLWNEYTAHRRRQANQITCDLEMSRVAHRDRKMLVEFGAMNETTSHFQTLFSCLMQVYHKPEDAGCLAVVLRPKYVQITCNSSKVYPNGACDIVQVEISQERASSINQSLIEQTLTPTALYSAAYFNFSCKTTVSIHHPGNYKFFAWITPTDPSGSDLGVSVAPVHTPDIYITAKDRIARILSPAWPLNICQGRKIKVVAKCEVLGFKSPPRFSWKLGNRTVPPNASNSHTFVSEERGNVSESTVQLTVRESDHNTTLTCEADESQDQYHVPSLPSSTTKLELSWPPAGRPQFLDTSNTLITSATLATPFNATTSLSCLVEGGNPEVSQTSITCDRLTGSEVTQGQGRGRDDERQHFTNTSSRVMFRPSGRAGDSFLCTCVASHPTNCYHKRSNLTLVLTGRLAMTSSEDRRVPVIIGVILGALLVTSVVVPLIWWRRKKCQRHPDHLYEDPSLLYYSVQSSN